MKSARSILIAVYVITLAISAQAQSPKSKWAEIDGARLHYYDVGKRKEKDALVLIHGWTCNADFWKDSYRAFPEYRVIAIDLPGHGRSDKPRLNYSIEYFARSVDAVMKHAGVEKAVLAGHSMGTPVARQFYRLFPTRTLGIIVVDGPLRPLAPKAQMDKFIAGLRADYRSSTAKYIDGMLRPIRSGPLRRFIRDGMLATPDHVGISAIEGMAEEKIWGDDKIDLPVLAVMAPLSTWPPGLEDAYKAIAPQIDLHVWSDVTHFLMMEKPKEFNEVLGGFIAKKKLL